MKSIKQYLESRGLSTATVESYYRQIMDYIMWCASKQIEVEEANMNEVMGYVHYLKQKGQNQATISRQIVSLKHYYSWLVKRDIRNDNPVNGINIKGVKKRKLYDILSHRELESIYASYPPKVGHGSLKTEIDKRNKVVVGLLVYQGLNSRDLSNLELKDVHLREAKIYIKGSRSSNERLLKVQAHQVIDLMEYQLQIRNRILEQSSKTTDQFILSSGSSDLLNNTLAKLLKQLKQQHPKIQNLHQIRTSVITHWLKQYNLREVQYMAGHKYVSSTESYRINDMQGLQDALDHCHPGN